MQIINEQEFIASMAAAPADLGQLANSAVGQPVTGTSAGSLYYVVAAREGVTMAMRWKGDTLSIRVAGAKLGPSGVQERLAATGLFADHGTYMSAHMGPSGPQGGVAKEVTAEMLYASLLAAGGAWERVAPYGWRKWTQTAPVN